MNAIRIAFSKNSYTRDLPVWKWQHTKRQDRCKNQCRRTKTRLLSILYDGGARAHTVTNRKINRTRELHFRRGKQKNTINTNLSKTTREQSERKKEQTITRETEKSFAPRRMQSVSIEI